MHYANMNLIQLRGGSSPWNIEILLELLISGLFLLFFFLGAPVIILHIPGTHLSFGRLFKLLSILRKYEWNWLKLSKYIDHFLVRVSIFLPLSFLSVYSDISKQLAQYYIVSLVTPNSCKIYQVENSMMKHPLYGSMLLRLY